MFAVLLVAGTFILLRKIEHWLHQHIFKVGWLLTHNYQTTTILYYTFFFPGVVLHEVTYWLMAGALNVSADLTIKWPEPQEMGELKLNFVRISPKAGIYRRAIITATPLLVALAIIWWGANSVFDLGGALKIMSTGDLEDIAAGFRHLTNAPDFWLWVYLIFTISNTMYPAVPKDLQGWRTIAGAVAIVAVLAFVIGIGQDAFQLVGEPIGEFLLVLQGVLIFIICINVFMTMVLGAVESVIERVTGHSATFKRGKMITMTREEAVALRHKDRERQRKQQALATTTRRPTAEMNISSVYALALPVPGGPDEEAFAVPAYKIEPESTPALPDRPAVSPRLGAQMITVGDAPSTAPALPTGPSTKTIPSVSGDTSTQKAVAEDQVDEAMRVMRINTPASRNAAQSDTPVTPAQIDKAVETFRAVAPDKPVSAPSPDKPGDSGANLPPRPQSSPAASAAPQGLEKPGSPFNRPAPSPFGTPKPAPSQPDDENDDDLDSFRQPDRPAAAKPATPPGSPFNRPAPSPFGTSKPAPSQPDEEEEDDDLDSFRQPDRPAAAKPVTPPSSPFNRPAPSPFGTPKPAPSQPDDEDDDDLDSFRQPDRPAAAKPATPPSSPFNRPAASPFGTPKPAPSQPDDEEEDRALFRPFDLPAAAKPSTPPNTPFKPAPSPFGTPKPTPAQSGDDDDPGSFRQPDRPAAAKPKDPEKGVPFNRPASPFGTPRPAANDEDDEDSALFRPFDLPAAAKPSTPFKPAASPFGTPKPTPSQADDTDSAVKPTGRAAKPPDPEKGVPFNRPASPFSFPNPAADDEDEDEDLSAFRKTDRTVVTKANTPFKPGSPFGTPQPSPDNDDDDDLDSFRQSDRPAASRPNTPFKPASPFGPSSTAPKPGEKDDPNAPRQPNRPAFGSPSPTSAKPMSPFGSQGDESKPTTPPAASGPRPGAFTPPPRFGAKPTTPTGTPVPKPSAPFGRKADDDEDESIMNRPDASLHDATDDLFEDLRRPTAPMPPKRPTTTQPIIGSGAFGASRPVPKKPTRPQDEDDDDLDDLRDTIRYEDEDLRYSDDDEVDVSGDDD